MIFQEKLELEKTSNIKKHEEKEIEVQNLQNKIREAEESKNAILERYEHNLKNLTETLKNNHLNNEQLVIYKYNQICNKNLIQAND